jgi:IS30 family transposase
MRKYSRITREQRYTIQLLLSTGKSQAGIAEMIGVHKSSVCRELKRNSDQRGHHKYNFDLAHRKADKRKKEKPHYRALNEEMKIEIRKLIVNQQFSPEQIVGRWKLEGKWSVSVDTIYKWIWKRKHKGDTEMADNLRHRGRKYYKRGNVNPSRGIIKDRVDISERPAIVDEKSRFGDLEIDTVIGKNHKGALMTTNDRCTHIVVIRKLTGKEATPLAETVIKAWEPYKDRLHTITADNGKEFAKHKEIADGLDVNVYFARPYHSWERGANENINGLIRQYIPKGTDFNELSDEFIAEIEWKLNNRPRKSLGYLTPLEYCRKMFNFDYLKLSKPN